MGLGKKIGIMIRRNVFHILSHLPYRIQRYIYYLWVAVFPKGQVTGGGECWVAGSWEEVVEMSDFGNLHRAYRYHWLGPLVKGKRVLDLGCGSGYGAYHISFFAEEVIGVDKNPKAIEWANNHFCRPNLRFLEMDALELDFPPNSFDVVACLGVIEHIQDQDALLKQVSSVCRDKLYISTPNASSSSARVRELKLLGGFGLCKWHVRELCPEDYRMLLERHFNLCVLLGIHVKGVETLEDWLEVRTRKLTIEDYEMVEPTSFDMCSTIMAICECRVEDQEVGMNEE